MELDMDSFPASLSASSFPLTHSHVLYRSRRLVPPPFRRRGLRHRSRLLSLRHNKTPSAPTDYGAITSSLQASQDITIVVNGDDNSGVQATTGELHVVERETDRRLRPFACGIDECQRRYMSMKSLRNRYRHSGNHGVTGLQLLASGQQSQHECLRHSKSTTASCQSTLAHSATTPPLSLSPSKSVWHYPQGSEGHLLDSPPDRPDSPASDDVQESSADDPQSVNVLSTRSSLVQEHFPASSPTLRPPDSVTSDAMRELLPNDRQRPNAVAGTPPSPTQEHIPAPPPTSPDRPLLDHIRELPTGDQCGPATNTSFSSTQERLPTSQSSPLRLLTPPKNYTRRCHAGSKT
ncbi:hypothetical protein BJV77DRAFT_380073 [Russula vinacea]|nr:hypothetical protein BJV77DRAFT_380073 [Russula vinacea]